MGGIQGQDCRWIEEGGSKEEQSRKDRLNQGIRRGQEAIRIQEDRCLGNCCRQGPQGSRNQGIPPCWRKDCCRKGLVRQGQVFLQEVNDSERVPRRRQCQISVRFGTLFL